jgi:hypothetical protein
MIGASSWHRSRPVTLAPPHHPPRPRSPAQREAARRNGARSNGPVTAEGKARASQNALRHGLCSPAILFPGEDPARFEALRAALEAEYAPGSPSARLLVERLAVTVWKLARCDRLEARLAAIEPHCPTGRLFPDPGLPRVLSRIPELATLLRWQAQLDRQLHRLTKSLAEHARFASPSGEPAPGEDGPAADGEPAPPGTFFGTSAAGAEPSTTERVEHDGAAGLANPSNEAEPGPLRVDQGAAVEPASSATEAGCPAIARQNGPNEAEAEGERIAARAATPGGRATPEGGTGAAEPGVRVPGPDASANPRNEPEAGPFGTFAPRPSAVGAGSAEHRAAATRAGIARNALPDLPNEPAPLPPGARAAVHPSRSGTGLAPAGITRRDAPNEPEPTRAAPGEPAPVAPDRRGPMPTDAAVATRNAAPKNLRNEPEAGAPLDRAGPGSGAECAGADVRDRRRAEARVPDAAPPTPTPEALLARGDLAGYLRARSSARPRHPPPTAPSAGPPRATPPPSHPPPRGKPDP